MMDANRFLQQAQLGQQVGQGLGSIAGTALTPFLGPLGPLTGSAIGMGLGELFSHKANRNYNTVINQQNSMNNRYQSIYSDILAAQTQNNSMQQFWTQNAFRL